MHSQYLRKPRFLKRHILVIFFFLLAFCFKPNHAEASWLSAEYDRTEENVKEAVKDAVDTVVGAANDTLEFIEGTAENTYEFAEHALAETYNFVDDAVQAVTDTAYFAYKKYMGHVHGGASDAYKLDPYLRDALMNEYPGDPGLLEKVRIYHSSKVPGDGIASSADAVVDCARIYFNDWSMVNNVKDAADYTSPTPVLRLSQDDLKLLLHELTHVEQCTQLGGRRDYAENWIDALAWAFINEILLRGDFGNVTQDIHDAMPMERDAMDKAQQLINAGIYARINDSTTITAFVRMNSLVGINLCEPAGGSGLALTADYLLLETQCQGGLVGGFNINNIRQITTHSTGQEDPTISGNRIVWDDYRNSNYDIYLYDLNTNTEKRITANWAAQVSPAISDNLIVWQDWRNVNYDIYLYDLNTNTERRITTNSANQGGPDISGNLIVWEDTRNGNNDIFLYDLSSNTERQITTNSADQQATVTFGNRVVWQDARNGTTNSDIYLYDLNTNTERRITTNSANQTQPAISGSLIVWTDYCNGTTNSDIYLYDLNTNTERRITTNSANQIQPAISGDLIIWQDSRNGPTDIYLYDLSTNAEVEITRESIASQWVPAISGDKIVWQDFRNGNSDIYFNAKGIAPVLGSVGNKTVNEGQSLSFSVSATDYDGDTLTYSAKGLPTGAAFNGQAFSWTPGFNQAGVYSVTFIVRDSGGLNDSETIAITVNNVNQPPVMAAIGNKVVFEGGNLAFTVSATDLDGNTLTYSVTGLPTGATFDAR